MSWLPMLGAPPRRSSFTHVSTHQTHVGKALYDHAPDCATVAAVACMSSSLLKSSLGPNLLALICINERTFKLFDKIFLEYNPHMQLTQELVVERGVHPDVATAFINKIKSNGPLFSSSLQHAEFHSKCLPLLENGFRSLRSLTLFNVEQCEQLNILKSLPSLTELKLINCERVDAMMFKCLGDLENNRNLISLGILGCNFKGWNSAAFQNDLCGRLLSKNRLVKLELSQDFLKWMNEDDKEAFVNAGMTNLVELGSAIVTCDLGYVPAKLIRGEGFENLRILSLVGSTDEELVNVGNHCLFLEFVELRGRVTGSFLRDNNLEPDAFKHLRELKVDFANFSDSAVGAGCSRFVALERLSLRDTARFDGSCLQHLPNPDRLRSVVSVAFENKFSIRNLFRFVNLEEVQLEGSTVTREDIMCCAVLKRLKRISLKDCGAASSYSSLFRVLCPQLPNLEVLICSGEEASSWTEEDVDAILTECKWLRTLEFIFAARRMSLLWQKYKLNPHLLGRVVFVHGALQNTTAKQESDSRREREE